MIENGVEADHWPSIGRASDADTVIFEYAKSNDYIVFTNDLDFGSILAATNASAPSVLQVRSQSLLPNFIGNKVLECLKQYAVFLNEGCLITLYDQKSKVRILPLKSRY